MLQEQVSPLLSPNIFLGPKLSSPVTVTCADKPMWESLLADATAEDVYYRPGYVSACEKAGHGRGVAVILSVGDSRFLIPLLLRPISDLSFANGMSGFDAVTPYGYGGLLRLSGPHELSSAEMWALFNAFREWCAEHNVVSVLLRLHPLLRQERWFDHRPKDVLLFPFGPTVALDLEKWNSDRQVLETLNHGRRSDLSRARRSLRLTWASQQSSPHQHLEVFRALYEHRMNELHAGEFYFFPEEYYTELTSGLGVDLDLAIAWLGDEAVAGSMFMAGRQFAHYHLSASNELGRVHKANTLMVNDACGWARSRGCRWLHLGGGARGADDLFQFKKSFGGSLFQYSFAGFVPDTDRYRELIYKRISASHLPAPRTNFFPEYRA